MIFLSRAQSSRRRSFQRGFTIVEMIISIGLFMTLMLIIVGALLTMTDALRKAHATRIALDNVGAAMDYMSREVRLGATFHCETGLNPGSLTPLSCPYLGGGGTLLALERAGGGVSNSSDQLVFRLNNNQIEVSTDSGVNYDILTSSEINIQSLRFYVDDTNYSASGVDGNQPKVTIVLSGLAGSKVRTQTTFALQTTLSARTPNIPPS